jgi:hypothetical protein
MQMAEHNLSGNRIYCAGGWSKPLADDLKNSNANELEILDDWQDLSCFHGYVDNIEYLKLNGHDGRIQSIDNISVFKKIKKLVILNKVKKKYDLSCLKNLKSIDAVWQPCLASAFTSTHLDQLILSSVDDDFLNCGIEINSIRYLWLDRPKLSSLELLQLTPKITTLRVSNSTRLESLIGIKSTQQLEELDIENSRKLGNAAEVVNLPKLRILRLMKVSPNFDVSILRNQKLSIVNVCIGGQGVPEVPWVDLVKNGNIKRAAGWWTPSDLPMKKLLEHTDAKRELIKCNDNGKGNKQMLIIELS